MTTLESNQVPNTPCENVKHYEVEGNNVIAVFWSKEQRNEYIEKYSIMKNTSNWHDQIGFANFSKVDENKINAHSTYHPENSLVSIFENGLKHI